MRTAVVTGGMSGIGAACVELLRWQGVEVFAADLRAGADVVLDVCNAEGVRDAFETLPQIDIVVNSAGIVGPNLPLQNIEYRDWQRTFDVNVNGTFNVCKAAVPGMSERGWGRIVNLASMAGKDGNPNMSAYSASKAAVIALTKSLGKELATSGVLVNAVAPAVVATPMNSETSETVLAQLTALIPMHRLGRPEEVAELVAWLCSDKCTFSTGAVFDISGGRATY